MPDEKGSKCKKPCGTINDNTMTPEYMSHWKIRLERVIAISRVNVFL